MLLLNTTRLKMQFINTKYSYTFSDNRFLDALKVMKKGKRPHKEYIGKVKLNGELNMRTSNVRYYLK